MWIDVHPTRNHGPYFESTLNWLWYSSKICIHIYKLNICICIFLYIIFIYPYVKSEGPSAVQSITRMTWMFKNTCASRISRLWVSFFLLKQKKQTWDPTGGVLKLKTAWYFCYKNKTEKKKKDNKKKKVKALGKEKVSQSPIDFLLILIVLRNPLLQFKKSVVDCRFRHRLNEVLGTTTDPFPSPTLADITYSLSHPTIKSSAIAHGITCTDISSSALYSYLVWILCCYSGFCRW